MAKHVFKVTTCAEETSGNPGCPFHRDSHCWWTDVEMETKGSIPQRCPLRGESSSILVMLSLGVLGA